MTCANHSCSQTTITTIIYFIFPFTILDLKEEDEHEHKKKQEGYVEFRSPNNPLHNISPCWVPKDGNTLDGDTPNTCRVLWVVYRHLSTCT